MIGLMRRGPATRSLTGLLVASMLPATALVQAAEPSLEEIIVTARRRTERLMDTPVSLSAIDQGRLKDGGITAIQDVVALVPNTSFEPGGDFVSSNIAIRGVSRERSVEEPGVGIYRDGVFIGGPITNLSDFYDIERLEILRGPQAGLYGRDAVGGALNILTNRPTFTQAGNVKITAQTKDRQQVEAMVNLPVAEDRLAVRAAVNYVNQDKGFSRNTFLNQELEASERLSARLRVLWQPTPDVEVLWTGYYRDDDGQTPPVARVSADRRQLAFNTETPFRSKEKQIAQEVNWATGSGTLTSVLSYRENSVFQQDDTDFTTAFLQSSARDIDIDSFYGELRYAADAGERLHYVAGLSVLREDQSFQDVFLVSVGVPGLGGFFPGGGGLVGDNKDTVPFHLRNKQRLLSLAGFADLTYDLTDRLAADFSLRYTRDQRDVHFMQTTPGCTACRAIVGRSLEYDIATDPVFSNVSPSAGLSYKATDDMLVYANLSNGFKAGGINEGASRPDLLPFDAEKSQGAELGVKATLARWAQVTAAGFYQRRKDALISVDESVLVPGFPSSVNALGVNAGRIDSHGMELEMLLAPLPGLTVNGSLGWLDASFDEFKVPRPGGSTLDYSGNQVPRSFKYSANATVDYRYPLTADTALLAHASYSNGWNGFQDNANRIKSDRPERINLRLGVERGDWRLTTYVNNLIDNRYVTYQVSTLAQRAPGRVFGVEAAVDF